MYKFTKFHMDEITVTAGYKLFNWYFQILFMIAQGHLQVINCCYFGTPTMHGDTMYKYM